MPVSTKLQVRRDTAANWTTTNPTLAAGEIGFETDTFKFKVGNGSTAWTSLKYSQDASLLNGTASITALTTTGDVTAGGILKSTQSTGDEGGQIDLTKSVTNTTITTGVSIDVFQNRLRFFETGGTNRGFYLDITGGGASAGTNLNGVIFNGGTITNALIVSNTSGVNTSGQFISTIATGTAPFVVSSTTQVANLNAATTSISVNIGAGAAGSLPYQSAANTTTYLARTATNNSTLAFNSSTNAPFWVQPTLSNTYYAATTSAQLAGVISDETGSGNLVFGTTPTITPANAVAATSASQAGYIGMPLQSKSGAYGVTAADAGKVIYYTTTGQTVTIPANSNVAFEIGTTLTFITAPSVSLSIAITTDTMYLAGTGTTGTRTLAQYGMATAVKITSTTWIISGNGLT